LIHFIDLFDYSTIIDSHHLISYYANSINLIEIFSRVKIYLKINFANYLSISYCLNFIVSYYLYFDCEFNLHYFS